MKGRFKGQVSIILETQEKPGFLSITMLLMSLVMIG
jgi:hypothetical protein